MAVTARIFDVLERDGLVRHAAELGEHAMQRLRSFGQTCPAVREVRGRGLFLGVQLDPQADGAWFDGASDVVNRCLERKLLVNARARTCCGLPRR